ncbi:Fc receptor-like protein 5 isoform X2 [Perca fluviatilis]|uniref:Fc receptor-like protein 5 isoform X2 n=1 Tax=Perca fluviatilis TaxID=8168 RepID=UPI0019636724|nr:Fc receptor-like protein 5 isoform X2 [Perca fluviatilis]
MSLTAAASGFIVFLLSVQVIQGQYGWGVTSTITQICALQGSTVELPCTYRYPFAMRSQTTQVEKRFWFTKGRHYEPVDLKTDSDYTGRVEYLFHNDDCTLRIRDLRERDSAEYKFRFITNHGGFTGSPGVTLSVTVPDLQVQVTRSWTQGELRCHSSCNVSDNPSYVWFNNGQKMDGATSSSLRLSVEDNNSYSCAVTGYEDYRSPPVYGPKLPSVSVSPSAEIVEGSSVNLTCSCDANPAANYTWYKENEDPPKASGQIFTITDFRAEHSGNYYCEAQNRRGRQNSTLHLTVVADKSTITLITNSIRLTLVGVVGLIPLLLFCRRMRKKKALSSTTEPNEPIETVETLVLSMRTSQRLQHRQKTQRSRKTWCEGQTALSLSFLSFYEAAGSRRFEKNTALFVPVQVHNITELSSGFDLVCKVIFYVIK